MKRKLAIFDMDGTLIDSTKKITVDVIDAYKRLGIAITEQETKMNWQELARKYDIPYERFDEEFDKRESWEESLRKGKVPIFPDSVESLKRLRENSFTLGLLTRSTQEATNAKLKYFNLKKYFEQVVVVAPGKQASKKYGALYLVSQLARQNLSYAYCIGDRLEDAEIAEDIRREFSLPSTGILLPEKRDLVSIVENQLIGDLNGR